MTELAPYLRNLVEERLPELLLLFEDCLKIQSFSGREQGLANLLLDFFRRHHLPAARTPRGSVVALLAPAAISPGGLPPSLPDAEAVARLNSLLQTVRNQKLPVLAFNAHMDVVEPGEGTRWEHPPFAATIANDRVYGRGTCDMKGALATMAMSLVLAQALSADRPLQRAILACFVTEEEAGEGLAFKEIIHDLQWRPDAVILGEPSEMQIARGQRGKLEFLLHAHGKRAHTSVPEVGENAAYKIARAILSVEALDRGEFRAVGPDPQRLLERSTLVATSFRTVPFTKSSVPDNAEAHVTVRLAKGETFESIKQKLFDRGGWPEVDIDLVTYRGRSYTGQEADWPACHPAWEVPASHPFFAFLRGAMRDILARDPTDRIWPFSTDGVYSAGHEGIPTLGVGPGREDVAHVVDEYVEIGHLREALALYSFLPFAPGTF
ncbi:MAG: M20/M25/M40 family metallo-hydrolase [Candidatus Riflebacteria bacterium]|nr:M20/M25/M40 family metallo-hydrolase [Candidatus Riflebacteria bacterium]